MKLCIVIRSISACCSCLMTVDMLAGWLIPPVAPSRACMLTAPALTADALSLSVHFMQDMYDKQRGKKRGLGSDADSDGGQIGFGSGCPAKKQVMSDEQVCCLRRHHYSVTHLHVVLKLLLGWTTPALL